MEDRLDLNIGHVTAYAYAKSKGYTGTEEQFAIELAQFAQNAQKVAEDRAAVEALVDEFMNTTVPSAVQSVTNEGTRQIELVGDAGTTQIGLVQDEGTTQIGNVNDAGTVQVGNVNQAGTTQVGNVTNEGTTQVNRVQAKGDEVIDSIPSDYSDLSNEVDDLTRQLSDVEENQIPELKRALNEVAEEASLDVTVTGEVAFFDDGSAKKPKSVIVEIPYTSGGLSSMTMRFHRRNMLCLMSAATSAGVTYTPQTDGSIYIHGSITGNSRYGYYGSPFYLDTNNIYNFPAGEYTGFVYAFDPTDPGAEGGYSLSPFTIYKGSSTTKIKEIVRLTSFTNTETQLGRILNFWSTAYDYDSYFKMFLGVGDCTIDDWDAPATTHHELEATFGTTIYGGTVDLTNGTLISKYASDGTELATPETISITVTEMPTLYEGANTIWASVVGSVVTVVYSKNAQNYVDKKVDELQDQIDAIVADDTTKTESEFCSLAMFEKIGIIGDSYATGSLYIPNGSGASFVGTYNNLSWGKNIQRLFGNTVSFFAHGGLSTRTWLTDTTNGMEALETAAQTSPCNLYWFGLGINDVGIYNDDNTYLGSITDISGHESGTAWATTFYGNVGQIIERIQAASQYSKIVISSFVGYRPKAQTAGDIALNNALEEIAEYYSLPFIKLNDDKFYMSNFYSNNILGKHPIAMLYSGMALANARLFGKAVFDNQTYFKDYHMGTPIPDPEPDDPT